MPITETHLESEDLTGEQEAALAGLESSLGCFFKDKNHLLTALRHRSYVNQLKDIEGRDRRLEDNQRYEFLGDAVLSLCVSTLLYGCFPDLQEGELSKMRAGLVNEAQLAEMARKIGVAPSLFLGRGEEITNGRDKNSILADALEAILAAVYLDQGFTKAMKVIEGLWGGLVAQASSRDLLKDFKTRLQELTQRSFGQIPDYRLTGTSGPDHARTFQVALFLGPDELSFGQGRSKKEAEQDAAQSALERLKNQDTSTP